MTDILAAIAPLLAESGGSTAIVEIVQAVLSFLSTALIAILGYYTYKVKVNSEKVAVTAKAAAVEVKEAAVKVEEVRTTLEDTTKVTDQKLNDLARDVGSARETGEKIHELVNSAMTLQLKVNAVALRRIAELTNNSDDIAVAALAEKSYLNHEAKQRSIQKRSDATPAPDDTKGAT